MKERPILFNSAMVRAILDGKKTQTRRVIKPQPTGIEDHDSDLVTAAWQAGEIEVNCPHGEPGDRLWVRETFLVFDGPAYGSGESDEVVVYAADHNGSEEKDRNFKYKPSIFMPRWASRITLEITDVRVQRLQEISNIDAMEEGISFPVAEPYRFEKDMFHDLWDSINAKRGFGWESNPWVWALTFRRIP